MSEDKNISLRAAHPNLFDPFILFLVSCIIIAGIIMTYAIFVQYPIKMNQEEEIKHMDCQSLKEHLLKNDLLINQQDIQSQIIGKCLK